MSKLQGIDSRRSWLAIGGLIAFATLFTGCSMMGIDDTTVTTTSVIKEVPTTVVKHDVSFDKWSLLMNASFDQAELNYGPAHLKVGGYANTGDTETARVIADGIIGGITAYFTAGASSVAKGVVKGMAASSAIDAKDTPVEAEVSEPVEAATPGKPVIDKIDTAKDVAPGKYAVVVLGNRKGCPLCRALWEPGFEAKVEAALPEADVIDADLTDSPALYRKYFPTEKWVYPYVIVFDKQGKRIGAFTARGDAKANFIGEVEKICPDCRPK